jgi:hypothetical protein
VPWLLYVLIGEEKLFAYHDSGYTRFLFDIYDRKLKNLAEDGAFISHLLETLNTTKYSTLWLHYDKCDMPVREEAEGFLKYWYEVELFERVDGRIGARFTDDELSERELVWLDISLTEPLDSPALLRNGLEKLRCVDWTAITRDLFDVSVREASSISVYEISRPIHPGEVIDYFISHSWHDDGSLKYDKLCEVAEDFMLAYGRHPTFWFDKVCINQNNIIEGLRVLPINVMACQKMLVLWGPTYCGRLWCIWELFTLNCFAGSESAGLRVQLAPITSESSVSIVDELKVFNVDNAFCYDPNEERKLRTVISANGKEQFNQRIQDLSQSFSLTRRSVDGSNNISLSFISGYRFSDSIVDRRV